MSREHTAYEWVGLKKAEEFLPSGQQNGIAKYITFLDDGAKEVVY